MGIFTRLFGKKRMQPKRAKDEEEERYYMGDEPTQPTRGLPVNSAGKPGDLPLPQTPEPK